MVARESDDLRLAAEKLDVLADDDSLGPPLDQRTQVQVVTGNDDQVELPGNVVYNPIILRQGIMQVGNDKTSHVKIP